MLLKCNGPSHHSLTVNGVDHYGGDTFEVDDALGVELIANRAYNVTMVEEEEIDPVDHLVKTRSRDELAEMAQRLGKVVYANDTKREIAEKVIDGLHLDFDSATPTANGAGQNESEGTDD